ncbi:hypothetical protein [Nocardioides sp. T2.26MG-1]|uniref:hypothetical protein n=1 Tax=Nocardioides sp. T2.26MG-1 TaxID=3041166 RepID=UPI002477BAE8|nr:hypothetical protein [Nocardioides sp. T2.26MG-1]CAI9409646.1 hypothetical protein HIDPHFAB_01329 [Nocardioides sp. T2.26MG-1]
MDLLANADLPALAGGLGLMLLSLLGLLVLRTTRRRARPAATVETDEPRGAEDGDDHVGEPDTLAPAGRSVEVRTLRAQVQCLEAALAQLPEPAHDPAGNTTDAATVLASSRAQVRATVRAVSSDCAPGVDARYVLDRLTAALDRLEQPGGLTRPVLPGSRVAALAPVARPVIDTPADPPLALHPDPPVDPPTDPPVQQVGEPPLPDEDEHVVPVPPPAVVEPRRQRRRLRRSAA